jgi:dUTP pyrophosphatase
MKTMYPTIPTVLDDGVALPTYAHEGDAGLDLCATEDVTLRPGEWKTVDSGIACAIPEGFAGLVMPRSGLGRKGLVIKHTLGLIDAGFRGKIGLVLHNNNPQLILAERYPKAKARFPRAYKWLCDRMGGEPLSLVPNEEVIFVRKGDRVAQLVLIPVARVDLVEVDTLDESDRGTGGFGSSGVRL